MLEKNRIYNTDCLAGMQAIEDKSIDMILCDLPYGVTDCRWDSVLPFDQLWAQYERVIKDNGAIVLDNCMGSGTTAVACIRSGRDFIGFELDAGYCEMADRRILQEK